MFDMDIAGRDDPETATSAPGYEVVLLGLSQLRPTEQCNRQRAASLARQILADGAWTAPLWVEQTEKVIMDGHHRWEAATILGFSRVPCLLLSYELPEISVVTWNANTPFFPADILAAGRSGRLLPYKTTRHILSRPPHAIRFALDDLR